MGRVGAKSTLGNTVNLEKCSPVFVEGMAVGLSICHVLQIFWFLTLLQGVIVNSTLGPMERKSF